MGGCAGCSRLCEHPGPAQRAPREQGRNWRERPRASVPALAQARPLTHAGNGDNVKPFFWPLRGLSEARPLSVQQGTGMAQGQLRVLNGVGHVPSWSSEPATVPRDPRPQEALVCWLWREAEWRLLPVLAVEALGAAGRRPGEPGPSILPQLHSPRWPAGVSAQRIFRSACTDRPAQLLSWRVGGSVL